MTEERLERMGLRTVGQIRSHGLENLTTLFGRWGRRLYELSCGHDDSEVNGDRPTKSISAEDTFERDIPLIDTTETMIRLSERVWEAALEEGRPARTVVLKLKTSDFKLLTRSQTPGFPISSGQQLRDIALQLLSRVDLAPETTYRLVGVGLSNFSEATVDEAQPALFDI